MAVFAILASHLKAFLISFHDINFRALSWACDIIIILSASVIIKIYEGDSSSTIATNITHIDIELNSSV